MSKDKVPLVEFLRNDSVYSSMRLFVMWTVQVALFLCLIAVVGSVVGSIVSIFVPDSKFSIDLGGVALIVGPMFAIAFGGKSIQSFSEKDKPIATGEKKE